MKKIIVCGTSGCGKTTLASELGSLFKLNVHDLDDYYWLPNWQEKNNAEFRNIISDITNTDAWIISGNGYGNKDITFARADTIIWLDYSFWICFSRAWSRTIFKIITKEKSCGDNYETIARQFFSKNSIFKWVITSFAKRKKQYGELFSNIQPNVTYLRFSNPRETEKWLKSLT